MSKLQRFVECGCGWKGKTHTNKGRSSMFLNYGSMCPNCGKQSYIADSAEFRVRVYRWVPKVKTWNPLTWFSGEWILNDALKEGG